MTWEYLALEQTIEMVADICAKFREKVMIYPHYMASEEMRMTHYHDMLRMEIQEYLSISIHKILPSLVEAVGEREN